MRGCAAEMRLKRVDFPAFGMPIIATSERSFRSRTRSVSSPLPPRCAIRGAWLVDVAKRALPRPPAPPRATTTLSPASDRSASSLSFPSDSFLRTCVPHGTLDHQALSPATVPVRALAVLTILSAPLVSPSHLQQCAHRRVGHHHHTAPRPTITTIWPALRDELLAAKANRAVPARSTFHRDFDVIDHRLSLKRDYTHVYQV